MGIRIQMVGTTWGKLTVIGEEGKSPSGNRLLRCRCSCGNESVVQHGNLRSGNSTQCVTCSQTQDRRRVDLIGQTFGNLQVVAFARRDGRGRARWRCECDCGKATEVDGYSLVSGHTKSCNKCPPTNHYELAEGFAYVYCQRDIRSKISIDSVDILRQYQCYVSTRNYLMISVSKRELQAHRFLLGAKHGELVDHKNGDTLDNRLENLRICTPLENSRNRRVNSNSQVGYKGVHFDKTVGRYRSAITVNGEVKRLGYFSSAEHAAQAYDKAAEKYFKEYAWLNFSASNSGSRSTSYAF